MSSSLTSIPKVSVHLDAADLKGVSTDDRQTVLEIFGHLAGAADRIKRAGQLWVTLSDKTRARVLDALPTSWQEFIHRLDRVGQGTLHPALYYTPGVAARHLGRLPIEEQAHYLQEKIPVALMDGRGRFDEIRVDIADMTEDQRRQVFKTGPDDSVAVRTLPEQQAWLRAKRERDLKPADPTFTAINRPGRWRVEKGRVLLDPHKAKEGLTKRDVQLMLRDLSPE